jgi:hypothetical protein
VKPVALVALVLAVAAGCGSSVFLGSLPTSDMARHEDMTQFVPFDGFFVLDLAPDGATDLGGFDAAPAIDLAQ